MGQQNSKPEPKKSDEDIMKERWANLAQSNKKYDTDNKENPSEKKQIIPQTTNIQEKKENSNNLPSNKIEIKNTEKMEDMKQFQEKIEINLSKAHSATSLDTSQTDSNTNIILDNPIKTLSNQILIEPKKIDKEHSTIEKIFRISLTPSEKFTHLPLYQAQLISENHEEAFRLNDLDNIILSIISEGDKKQKIILYLLETYHRAIEMIEKRYRNEYDEKYLDIRKIIASYLALIIYAPENFEMKLDKNDTMKILSEYFDETDPFEIENLIADIVQSTSADFEFMQQVFSYVINVIHMDNISPKNNFFNCDKMKKNLNILL